MRRWSGVVAFSLALLAGVVGVAGSQPNQGRWVIHDLGSLGGNSGVAALNERGQVVGWASGEHEPGRLVRSAVVWENGRVTNNPFFLGYSSAADINEQGLVIGKEVSIGWAQERWRTSTVTHPVRRSLTEKFRRVVREVGGEAVAVNERGQVVGGMEAPDTRPNPEAGGLVGHAFLWEKLRPQDLGTLGGPWSMATAINDRGQVIGWADTKSKSRHAFLWEDAKMRDLGAPGGTSSSATAINGHGQVIGTAGIAEQSAGHAFLWQAGKMRDLGTLGGPSSAAFAINEQGQVVGQAETMVKDRYGYPRAHAFLWQDGKMRDLGTLGGRYSFAAAINREGQVVGSSTTRTGDWHAFVWQSGRMIDLGLLPGHRGSTAVSINDRGQIIGNVGYSQIGDLHLSAMTNRDPWSTPWYKKANQQHAVLWTLRHGT